MPVLDTTERILTAQYRFMDHLSWKVIATKVPNVKAEQARSFCSPLKNRHPDASAQRISQDGWSKKPRGKNTRHRMPMWSECSMLEQNIYVDWWLYEASHVGASSTT